MTRQRAAGALVGVVFGIVLCWSGMADPDVIRAALLLEQSYLFLFFGLAACSLSAARQEQREAVREVRPAFDPQTARPVMIPLALLLRWRHSTQRGT